MQAALIFPHQLFPQHSAIIDVERVYLVEEALFFKQYTFHRQKLAYHRATMQSYAATLGSQHCETIGSNELNSTVDLISGLQRRGVTTVKYVDPCDDWLERRLQRGLKQAGISAAVLPDPHFLTPRSLIDAEPATADWYFTDFYVRQRKRLRILIDDRSRPVGGKWSYDAENRKKLPRGMTVPRPVKFRLTEYQTAAESYVANLFPQSPGRFCPELYPLDTPAAERGLEKFLNERFALFGDYEDAVSNQHDVLFHSLLTPALNTGLLSPQRVVDRALERAEQVPLNALEGFLRQIIGWREYMRAVYLRRGRAQRTANFWGHTADCPAAFYTGQTGIPPIDRTIQRVLDTGYCHHIERLMILGNFMLLCELKPDAVYRWFMESFIDAYDWVMVPNVYGMSQYADGGSITTKPYISGSAYVLKMSDYPRGSWSKIWDALYWRFVDRHRQVFAANPRMSMMAAMCVKLGDKLREHHRIAERFLERLHGGKLPAAEGIQ